MLEIRDIDQWTDKEELVEAVGAATGAGYNDIRVISFRKGFGGMQAAIVLVPLAAGKNLAEHGRIRIGMVNCRIREGKPRIRCFRCLSFGHLSGECKGPDRSLCCRRCGVAGYQAAKCEATFEAMKEFASQLEKQETGESSGILNSRRPEHTQ